jgi:peroxiredoxin
MRQHSVFLAAGDPAADFELPALNGESVGLRSCLLEGPLYLEFIRGTWCPNARRRLDELERIRERFRSHWTRPLVIACEDPFTARRYFARRPTPLTVLLDSERRVARAYGCYQRFGLNGWNISRPAGFLIDRAGFIRWSFLARIQTESPDLEAVFSTLERLAGESPPQRE